MGTVQSFIRAQVSRRALKGTQVFGTYAISSSGRPIPEMDMAARLSLDLPTTIEHIGVELRLFEAWALRALVKFRMLYRTRASNPLSTRAPALLRFGPFVHRSLIPAFTSLD